MKTDFLFAIHNPSQLKHNDTFKIGSLDVRAVATPCHTQDHICYYVEDKAKNQRAVFTGDTLFISGKLEMQGLIN